MHTPKRIRLEPVGDVMNAENQEDSQSHFEEPARLTRQNGMPNSRHASGIKRLPAGKTNVCSRVVLTIVWVAGTCCIDVDGLEYKEITDIINALEQQLDERENIELSINQLLDRNSECDSRAKCGVVGLFGTKPEIIDLTKE